MTLSKMREMGTGEIEVLVDNEVSRENVSRAAEGQGWKVDAVMKEAEEYRMLLRKQ